MRKLLTDIFNYDFAKTADSADFHAHFFAKTLTIPHMAKMCEFVCASSVDVDGKTIPGAIRIKGKKSGIPFAILAQLHGNEPAGLAGIALAIALSQAGQLEHDVIGIIGNTLAAKQYFAAYARDPKARQETRDAFRCGLSPDGVLLPDMNRIPVDFLSRDASDHHTKRAQELWAVAQHVNGIVDIHSARGNMLCITDHKRDGDLKNSPIRAVLTGLAEAISAHASATVAVQTFKTILAPLPHIKSHTGIEAGRHEHPDSPHHAASFTLSLLNTLGITNIAPLFTKEDGIFENYAVQPRITYADLKHANTLLPEDKIYMAKLAKPGDTILITLADGRAFTTHQYDEMEAIAKDEIVAIAVPSGTTFSTTSAFSGIFLSKSAALYDKDPAVGPWPVSADKIGQIKFCYPCIVSKMHLSSSGLTRGSI